VSPANINMFLHPEQFSEVHIGPIDAHLTQTGLGVRLIVQIFLLAVIVWSTMLPVKEAKAAA